MNQAIKYVPDENGSVGCDCGDCPAANLPHSITLENPNGKKAVIDFSGDVVVYSGDLPVEESAQILFDAVCGIYKQRAVETED